MKEEVSIRRLSGHRELLPVVASWFREEWPDWYGASAKGNARDDLLAYANAGDAIPFGLVAFYNDIPSGFGALKKEAIPAGSLPGPWVGAGYVVPEFRRRGIGSLLLRALIQEVRRIGFEHIYCGTSTSVSLLAREGWEVLEVVQHAGARVTVFKSPA